ncbi:GNAT family N-acetyltransferase [Microbacterium protaetiae]|nr:GNAT family N-acetyltransferase [Microbacterium protaetiae]
MDEVRIRPAVADDAAGMARVHVETWRETYRGLMRDEVLDRPGFEASRHKFWTAAITDPRFARNRIAVAHRGDELIGIAMAGPPMDAGADASWSAQLYVLYVYAAHHGSGAGGGLLDAVIDPGEPAALWVADPNPRAQAFYRKHGFAPDGTSKVDDGVGEIRMVRAGR